MPKYRKDLKPDGQNKTQTQNKSKELMIRKKLFPQRKPGVKTGDRYGKLLLLHAQHPS